jgi:PAS domain S-box-containing protein
MNAVKSAATGIGCFMLFFWIVAAATCSAFDLTQEESAYIHSTDTIIFVSQTHYPPFEFIDAQGQHDGMMIDIIRWMAVEIGFRAVFTDMSFQQAQDAVLIGKADVLTSLFYSDKRAEKFSFTQPLFDVPAAIFVKAERTDIKDIADLNGKTIAIQKGDYAKDFLETQGIRFDTLNAQDFFEATNMVLSGQADAIIGDEQIVFYHIFSNRLTDAIKKVGEPLYTGKNCMAASRSNARIIDILNKGISEAKKIGQLEKIEKKWLGTKYSHSPISLIDKYRWHFAMGITGLLLIFLWVWFWNVRLRSLVRKKTADIVRQQQEIIQSEMRYRSFVENAAEMVFRTDETGHLTYVNQSGVRLSGYPPEELLGTHYTRYIRPDKRIEMKRFFIRQFAGRQPTTFCRFPVVTKDGREIWLAENTQLIFRNDQIVGFLAIARDITENKQIQDALQESETRYRLLAENATDVIWTIGMDMQLTYSSPSITKLLGFSVEEALARSIQQAYTPESLQTAVQMFMEEMALEDSGKADPRRSKIVELDLIHKNGSIIPVEGNFSFIRDPSDKAVGILAIIRDITARKQAENALKASLQEKEILLREIHHRVKNNMQVICSLLNLQAEKTIDAQEKQVLIESQQRIAAMSMIHETLYRGENLAALDLAVYLKNLAIHLQTVYSNHTDVEIVFHVEKVELNIDQAVPCGLILNELISNAFKHAFSDTHTGTIHITLYKTNTDEVVLEVRDNGVGLSSDQNLENPSSLGLRLILGLLRHQLKGTLDVSVENGTAFILRWPLVEEQGDAL